MLFRKTALIFFLVLALRGTGSSEGALKMVLPGGEMLVPIETLDLSVLSAITETERPSPLFQMFRKKQAKNKKLTAALLAFPFPLGIVGMHRIYLGTAPYVPVVYIASIGGVFGILPFIDFCMILLEKDVERYSNNTKVFMWVD